MDIKKLEKYLSGCSFTFGIVRQRSTPPGDRRTCFFSSSSGPLRSELEDMETCLAMARGEVMMPSAKNSVPSWAKQLSDEVFVKRFEKNSQDLKI